MTDIGIQMHGFGRRWLPVDVRARIFLRRTTSTDGIPRHRNIAI